MSLFRVEHNKNYTTVNNTICRDNRISWKAKGIWLYAFSRPDDWIFYQSDLMNQSTDGRDSIRAGLKELQDAGYLRRTKTHGTDGKFLNDEWTFYETPQELKEKVPQTAFPAQAKPTPENPALGNRPLLSTEKLITENDIDLTDKGINKKLIVFKKPHGGVTSILETDLQKYLLSLGYEVEEINETVKKLQDEDRKTNNIKKYIETTLKNQRIGKHARTNNSRRPEPQKRPELTGITIQWGERLFTPDEKKGSQGSDWSQAV
jgi:hypothetical protein